MSRPQSYGLLAWRRAGAEIEVFLVHPGGPYFQHKDEGVWSVPKGVPESDERPLATARREFAEETGFPTPEEGYLKLGKVAQKRKLVHAWAFAGDWEAADLRSNTVEIEWPPRSGRSLTIPEVDRGEWFNLRWARRKIKPAQAPFLDRLLAALDLD